MSRADRPFVDQPAGDVTRVTAAAHAAAEEFGLGPVQLLRLGMNGVFAAGEVVVRVSRPTAPASAALDLAGMLLATGIPVPRPASDRVVSSGELTATIWEQLDPVDEPIAWDAVGRIVARVHLVPPTDVPATHPLPSPTSFPWWDFEQMLADTSDDIDPAALEGLRATLERCSDWRAEVERDVVVCHGDVHPGNVVMTVDGPVLIDWDLLCVAPPAWDHAAMMTLASHWGGRQGEYEEFAEGYGRSMRSDPAAIAFAELRLVAATLMRVVAGRSDPAAASEAVRRLRYWRGGDAWPMWHAQ